MGLRTGEAQAHIGPIRTGLRIDNYNEICSVHSIAKSPFTYSADVPITGDLLHEHPYFLHDVIPYGNSCSDCLPVKIYRAIALLVDSYIATEPTSMPEMLSWCTWLLPLCKVEMLYSDQLSHTSAKD